MASVLRSFFHTCNSKIEEPVRLHLKNVYACLTMSMVAAAAGAYVDMFTNFLSGTYLSVLAAIGFLIALRCTADDGKSRHLRIGFLLGFAFCTGLGLGPLMSNVILIEPSIIPTAFFYTALIFVSFSISSLLAKRGSYLFLGGIISATFLFMFFTTIISLFTRSQLLFNVHLWLGLGLMSAFVLYDTQLIMEKRRFGDKDFVAHSVDLFIDFIGIFRRILIILAQKENDKRNKRR